MMPRAPSHSRQVSIGSPDVTHWGLPHPPKDPSESPTLKLLVCGDVDIDSSSALVEYTLQQCEFDMGLIDLVVAVGPFVEEGDLDRYIRLSGRGHCQRGQRRNHSHPASYFHGKNVHESMLPLLRSYEDSCAMEGIVTSVLAQLENIVCRVVYCPGPSDPVTILRDPSRRLTSNSRNIHKRSLALVPGLAVAGLVYFDRVDEMVRELELRPTTNRWIGSHRYDDEEESISENSNSSNVIDLLVNQLQPLKFEYVSAPFMGGSSHTFHQR